MHKYAGPAPISSGLATGQAYQQFMARYAGTRTEQPTKLGQSGHQVSVNLAVLNDCTVAAQYHTGTHTARSGRSSQPTSPAPADPLRHPRTSRVRCQDGAVCLTLSTLATVLQSQDDHLVTG